MEDAGKEIRTARIDDFEPVHHVTFTKTRELTHGTASASRFPTILNRARFRNALPLRR